MEVPPGYHFAQIEAGLEATCGISRESELVCFGDDYEYKKGSPIINDAPTDGTWLQVSVGAYNACALSTEHEITCWGNQANLGPLGEIPDVPE